MLLDLDMGVTPVVLDALAARSKVVMHNIANQNTPGYKKYRVQFEDALRSAYDSGASADSVVPVVARDNSGEPGVNNVSVVEELSLLNKVTLMHDVFSRRAAGYFSHLKRAIRGS